MESISAYIYALSILIFGPVILFLFLYTIKRRKRIINVSPIITYFTLYMILIFISLRGIITFSYEIKSTSFDGEKDDEQNLKIVEGTVYSLFMIIAFYFLFLAIINLIYYY